MCKVKLFHIQEALDVRVLYDYSHFKYISLKLISSRKRGKNLLIFFKIFLLWCSQSCKASLVTILLLFPLDPGFYFQNTYVLLLPKYSPSSSLVINFIYLSMYSLIMFCQLDTS